MIQTIPENTNLVYFINATDDDGVAPIGTIHSAYLPENHGMRPGWVRCDGQSLDGYPELSQVLGRSYGTIPCLNPTHRQIKVNKEWDDESN